MRHRLLLVLAVAAVLVLAAGSVAVADTAADNAQCLSCHALSTSGSSHKVDFAVGAVDYSACSTCHYKYKHFEHPGVPTPCTNCHLGARSGAPYYYADTSTASGYFSDTTYASKTPEQLHAIHVNGDWVASYFRAQLGCRNCHANASCTACHQGAVSHGEHSSTTYAPITYSVATGSSVVTTASTCVNPSCHALANAQSTDFVPSCSAVCHETYDVHYDAAAHSSIAIGCSGDGCHEIAAGLMQVHAQRNADFGCGGCHSSVRQDVQYAINAGLTGCGDCHEDVGSGHRWVHWANPLLQDAGMPYYAYYTGSTSGVPTSDCAGCHTSNLLDEHMGMVDPEMGYQILPPQHDSTGSALTCETCHATTDEQVVSAVSGSGLTACENCHSVHGPITAVHQSTFLDSPPMSCGNCHSSDLTVVHGGTYTSSAGLTGCDVCHALYTGVLGAATQSAIALSNDTRCTACHITYHTDSQSHEATSPASLSCAGCHARGRTAIEIGALHGGVSACPTCHSGTSRIGDVSTHTPECGSCHATQGVDYHRNMAAAHRSPVSTYETCSGCHHNWGSNPLQGHDISLHKPGCTVCHNATYDLTGKTALCSDCHLVEGQGTPPEGYHTTTNERHSADDFGSLACADCHQTTNVRELHVTPGCETCHTGGCASCHSMHGGMGGALLQSTSCSRTGCHTAEGTDFHSNMTASHTYSTMPTSCMEGVPCHQANTLPEEHYAAAAQGGYTRVCDVCHRNEDPSRIPAGATAACTDCHAVHADIDEDHTSIGSVPCVECHESADVRAANHGQSLEMSCVVCHAAPEGRIDWSYADPECSGCHPGRWPMETNHYDLAAHAATPAPACLDCHGADLKTEHAALELPVGCVQCHEQAVDLLVTPWDGSCEPCHTDLSATHPAELSGATITGTVTDANTGLPLRDATISVAGKTDVTGADGVYSIEYVEPGVFTITASLVAYAPWSDVVTLSAGATSTKDIHLVALIPVNLALTGTASASSTYSTYTSAKAIDGNSVTYWRSTSSGAQWMRVDLGSNKMLTRFVANWQPIYYARAYRIETSVDGVTWISQYATTAGGPGVRTVAIAPVSARYVRIYCTSAASGNYRLSEFEVWGY